jgi:hypothetical protein
VALVAAGDVGGVAEICAAVVETPYGTYALLEDPDATDPETGEFLNCPGTQSLRAGQLVTVRASDLAPLEDAELEEALDGDLRNHDDVEYAWLLGETEVFSAWDYLGDDAVSEFERQSYMAVFEELYDDPLGEYDFPELEQFIVRWADPDVVDLPFGSSALVGIAMTFSGDYRSFDEPCGLGSDSTMASASCETVWAVDGAWWVSRGTTCRIDPACE